MQIGHRGVAGAKVVDGQKYADMVQLLEYRIGMVDVMKHGRLGQLKYQSLF
ncbi:MAG: hypothetical protein JAY90_16825 [Candidatus Thiodiazotropha lotti]|nr:hypothetical protein [Candidatus Thiodiazotropha lotti]